MKVFYNLFIILFSTFYSEAAGYLLKVNSVMFLTVVLFSAVLLFVGRYCLDLRCQKRNIEITRKLKVVSTVVFISIFSALVYSLPNCSHIGKLLCSNN